MNTRFARFYGEKTPEGIPKQDLCISSFVMVRKDGAVLLGKALFPEFAKGRWVIPASHLLYGEHPDEAAKRVLKEQLKAEVERIFYRGVWSYLFDHWDLCFIYEATLKSEPKPSSEEEAKNYPEGYLRLSQLLADFRYFKPEEIDRQQLGRGHEYVLASLGILRRNPRP